MTNGIGPAAKGITITPKPAVLVLSAPLCKAQPTGEGGKNLDEPPGSEKGDFPVLYELDIGKTPVETIEKVVVAFQLDEAKHLLGDKAALVAKMGELGYLSAQDTNPKRPECLTIHLDVPEVEIVHG